MGRIVTRAAVLGTFLLLARSAASETSATPRAEYSRGALGALSSEVGNGESSTKPATKLEATADSAEGDNPLPGLSNVPKVDAAGTSGGVSGQAVALPGGASSVTGMGESFTTQLSTGILSFGVPIRLPAARGGVQPRLDLSYSSGGGFGVAGKGWNLGGSAISRQTDRGIPRYDDRSDWYAGQDRFLFGGSELVPICKVAGTTCEGMLVGEGVPAWANGWQYFRARVEGGFLRFFWSPDHRSWRVQSKEGATFEFGIPLDGSGYADGLEVNPDRSNEIFRWYMVRQYDAEGGVHTQASPAPVNVIVYRYVHDGGAVYLSDVYDTPPAPNPTSAELSTFAHHAALVYDSRPDAVVSYRSGWRVEHRWRLGRIDVASKPFVGSVSAPRELVRRYHLQYDAESHASLLVSVQMEGRCASAVVESGEKLPATTCPRLPPVTLQYQHAAGTTDPLRDAAGMEFEAFDTTVREMGGSPPHSLDESPVGLVDVNSDGLPDLLATSPGLYGGNDGVFFNGAAGKNAFGTATQMSVIPVGSVDAGVLRLSSPNVSTLDLDADGIANLVHMELSRKYSVFHPEQSQGKWSWRGTEVTTASGQDVKIDFTRDARNTQVMDVNGDGLVDVVYSTATEYQTFLALGRFPGGENQFGQADMTTADSAKISNDPIRFCTPWSAATVRFSDPDTRVADLNGDGLPDIARVRSGQILYWPGRGNGFWGTGDRDDCAAGTFGQDRHIEMFDAPRFGITDAGTLLMSDVNADGFADLVEVRNDAVDVYLNEGGLGWTDRRTLDNTPVRPPGSNWVRLTDIDGSGSPDILWGEAYNYRYLDLTGGVIPHLLTKIENGLGASTEFAYKTTAQVMREADASGNAWTSRTPTNSPVLVRSTVRDHLELVGRSAGVHVTEYAYRNPVYEGRQREFRGFRDAYVKVIGDANGPSSTQHTAFQLGECLEGQTGAADVCSPENRWKDNWREALKGLTVVSEAFDEQKVYLSTEHTSYRLLQLYTGRDRRRVVFAHPYTKDTYLYDSDPSAFDRQESPVTLPEVDVLLSGITSQETRTFVKRASAGTAHVRAQGFADGFGNLLSSTRFGCIDGCPNGADEAITATSFFERPAGDASGWAFRETAAYVAGSVDAAPRRQVKHSYNAQGKLVESRAVLTGTLALDRFHENASAGTAPVPLAASGGVNGPADVLLVHNDYDSFGRVVFVRGSSGRCSSSESDPQYAQVPIISHTRAGNIGADGCGTTDISSRISMFDRGLEQPTEAIDANGQPARIDLDGFGRVIKTWAANPQAPGTLAAVPTSIVTYDMPQQASTRPWSAVYVDMQDAPDVNGATYHRSVTVTDGLGRSIVSQSEADATAGEPGNVLVTGPTLYNAKGAVSRQYTDRYVAGSVNTLLLSPVFTDFTSAEYDAFGRPVTTFGLDHIVKAHTRHHAMSQDIYDAADLASRAGTHTTVFSDGHGRGAKRIVRVHSGAAVQEIITLNAFLPTSEVRQVIQRTAGQPDVVRWFRYDSLGRLVANVEPNTSSNFSPDPDTDLSVIKAFRYAYNDAGDLVGTSDARGCGVNYYYDAAGRVLAEDRSPCLSTQATYTSPNLTSGEGTEALYRYDVADPESDAIVDAANTALSVNTGLLLGRLVSVAGLGSKEVFRYDARGDTTGIGVRIAAPGTPSSSIANRYAPRWYVRILELDSRGRTKVMSTGATPPQLQGADGQSHLTFAYSKSGAVRGIAGSYGTLFRGATYTADGQLDTVTLGDAAATQRAFTYDVNRRISTVMTYRAEAPLWSSPPPGSTYTAPGPETTQLQLEHYRFQYDDVGNVVQIRDFRTDVDWPNSTKPITRTFEYDDLYRLTRATYKRANGGPPDAWTSPYAAEVNDRERAPSPSPHVSFPARMQEQTFVYDWLGTIQRTTDDANGFWDRSLGDTTRGSGNDHPHQIRAASNRAGAPSSPSRGDLSLAADATGNYTDLIVRREGSCLPNGTSCWQRFKYEWNEVGELVRARRWDLTVREKKRNAIVSSELPKRPADIELKYVYDASGNRVVKSSGHGQGAAHYTAYILGGLELRNTVWDATAGPPDYSVAANLVQLRLPAGPATARVLFSETSLPSLSSGQLHVFLELSDQIGSSTFVIDQATGELVEAATYAAYGATESDYRPERWGEFREAYRFSGKEEDIEVGLQYFGARYYSPYLGIWISPDPSTIHELGSDTNPYAYVHGSPVVLRDPDGRIVPLIAAIAIGVAVGAIIGGGSSVVAQAAANDWNFDKVEWGLKGVAGAAIVGAVAGGVTGGVGSLAGGAMSGFWGGVATGAISGASGGGASYATSAAISGQRFSFGEFGKAVALGGVAGAAGASVGYGAGSLTKSLGKGWSGVLSAAAGSVGGGLSGSATSALIFGDKITGQTLALSLGTGLAGAMMGWAAFQATRSLSSATATENQLRNPSDAEVDAAVDTISKQLKAGNRNGALRTAARLWGIPEEVTVEFDANVEHDAVFSPAGNGGKGSIRFSETTFAGGANNLASTVLHESVHVGQWARGNLAGEKYTTTKAINESEGYAAELNNADRLGLGSEQGDSIASRAAENQPSLHRAQVQVAAGNFSPWPGDSLYPKPPWGHR